ncbi:MAG TPA: hypothetical protein VMT43_02590, partial [Acidimicrobiales bacterium]|nr:hypothetical protein [Acidimicrobiales bacterium]
FVWRRLQGIPIRGPRPDAVDDALRAATTTPAPSATPPVPGDSPADRPADRSGGSPSFPPLSSSPPAGEPSVGTAGADAGGRRGFFAPSGEGAPGTSPREPVGRATVAEAVRGIEMPCGLSPVIDGAQSIPNPFRAAFLTSTADPASVGAGLADELERLGFTLSTTTPTELLARRATIELRVVLYPNPATAKRGLERIFPAAAAGSVGVELST